MVDDSPAVELDRPAGVERLGDRVAARFAAGARAVLVTGPAGVGKSSVLATVAARDGGVVRSLRGCVTTADVVRRLTPDLALPLEAVAPTGAVDPAALAVAVGARPAHTFFLDDGESLDEGARGFLAAVLAAAPAQRLVVASRIGPRIPAEHVVRLEPLSDDDAVATLVAVARRSAPDWSPDASEREAIRDLARALGRLPLALVMAAPRLPLLGARALARTLGASAGESVLEHEIAASIAELPRGARALLAPLAQIDVFDLALVERLGGTAVDLEALHACSLLAIVRAPGRVRYALYESVRDVVLRDAGARDAAPKALRRALAAHAASLAADVRSGVAGAYESLALLTDALLSAVSEALAAHALAEAAELAVALDVVPIAAARLRSVLDRLEPAVRGTAHHAPVLIARGRAAFQLGDLTRGVEDMDAVLALAEAPPLLVAFAASKAALVRVQRGEASAQLFARAAEGVRHGDRWLRASVLRDRALAAMRSGRDEDARRDLEDALLLEPFGDELGAMVRGVLGQLHQHAGELDAALERFREVAVLATRAESHTLAAWGHATAGSVETELGRFDDARRDLDAALRIATEQNAHLFVAVTTVIQGQLAHETGELARATVLYQRAIPALLRVKQQRGAAFALAACAAAEGTLGRRDVATSLLAQARRELSAARPGDDVALDAFAFAALGGDAATAAAIEERARAVPSSDELRLALRRMRTTPRTTPPPPLASPALRIARDGAWFEADAGRVHLPERSPLRRVLAALLVARLDAPGTTRSPRALFAAAWPAERALPAALSNRVKVAVSTLRSAGLRPFLQTVGGAYRLDPEAAVAADGRD
jgi:tetratricopeptide (TPR) repeat protein